MHFLPFFVSCSLAFLWERMNQFQHISLMLNLIPPFSPVLVHSEAPLHSSQTPKWRCECTGAWPCRHWRCRPTCPRLSQSIQPLAEGVSIPSCILQYWRDIIWFYDDSIYDSMILCICACFGSRWKVEENIPTLAEISQYILPGHFLLVLCAAMLSGCCVCQQCEVVGL